MIKAVVASCIFAVGVAGCTGQPLPNAASHAADTKAPILSPSPTAIPSPTRALEVTRETICFQVKAAVFDTVKLVAKVAEDPTLDSIEVAEVRELADTFEHASTVAPDEMTAQLDAQARTLREVQKVLETGANTTLQFEDFKSANIDLVLRCDYFPDGIGDLPRPNKPDTGESEG